MSKPLKLLAAGTVILIAFHMQSAFSSPSAGELLTNCGAIVRQQDNGAKLSDTELVQGVSCIQYLSGLLDGVTLTESLSGGATMICAPASGISNDQLVRVVVKYLREHPENLHRSGRMEALIALSKAFPCK
jgi:hypothetical protein